VVAECRAGPLQLVDERDQVLHSHGMRSGQVVLGVGGREIGGRRVRGEVSPAASVGGRPCADVERSETRKERERERIRQREWSGGCGADRDMRAGDATRKQAHQSAA
jgi:hypothetical protein